MTRSSSPRAACVWICLLAAPAFAADWIAIKSPQELTALYSNKTFKGNGWTAHYRDDGKGVMILRSGKRIVSVLATMGTTEGRYQSVR